MQLGPITIVHEKAPDYWHFVSSKDEAEYRSVVAVQRVVPTNTADLDMGATVFAITLGRHCWYLGWF